MMGQTMETSVRKSVVVDAPIERAFRVFTEEIGSWWPRDYHLVQGELAEMVFEPRAGGHVYDRGADGSECRWARVLAYEPPKRVVISWDITPQWQLETDPSKASEVEILFTAEAAGRTRIDLQHGKLERHGADWEQMRDGVAGGWNVILERYAAAVRE